MHSVSTCRNTLAKWLIRAGLRIAQRPSCRFSVMFMRMPLQPQSAADILIHGCGMEELSVPVGANSAISVQHCDIVSGRGTLLARLPSGARQSDKEVTDG